MPLALPMWEKYLAEFLVSGYELTDVLARGKLQHKKGVLIWI